jgi:hypothetical protein
MTLGGVTPLRLRVAQFAKTMRASFRHTTDPLPATRDDASFGRMR